MAGVFAGTSSSNSAFQVQPVSPTHPLKISSVTHEHVNITGSNYEIVVGWVTEPPTVGIYNGVLIEINMFSNGSSVSNPVADAENNITVIISKGGVQTDSQPLTPNDETPGSYYVPILPTQEGVYVAHITGTLGSTIIDQSINLDAVQPVSAVAFPVLGQDTTVAALQDQISSLNSQSGLLMVGLAITLVVALGSIGLTYLNYRTIK